MPTHVRTTPRSREEFNNGSKLYLGGAAAKSLVEQQAWPEVDCVVECQYDFREEQAKSLPSCLWSFRLCLLRFGRSFAQRHSDTQTCAQTQGAALVRRVRLFGHRVWPRAFLLFRRHTSLPPLLRCCILRFGSFLRGCLAGGERVERST